MRHDSRRAALRAATHTGHQRLDVLIPDFQTIAAYSLYLRGTCLFRAAVEDAMEAPAPNRLAQAVRADIDDLDLAAPAAMACGLRLDNPSRIAGTHYVLEGSALGAKLLIKRAGALGLNEAFGARHLAEQIRLSKWADFVTSLEAMPDFDLGAATDAANETFAFAYDAYRECR